MNTQIIANKNKRAKVLSQSYNTSAAACIMDSPPCFLLGMCRIDISIVVQFLKKKLGFGSE